LQVPEGDPVQVLDHPAEPVPTTSKGRIINGKRALLIRGEMPNGLG